MSEVNVKPSKRVVYDFPVTLQPVIVKGKEVPYHKAVMRSDTYRVLGIVSDRYKLIPNKEVINSIESSLPVTVSSRKISICDGGALMFVNYESPKIESVEVRKGDVVKFGIQLFNSYNGRIAVGMRLLAYRLVCENGMTVPRSVSTLNVRHLPGANIIEAREAFTKKIEQFVKYSDTWRKWSNKKPSAIRMNEFTKKYFGKKSQEIVTAKFKSQNDNTVWGFFNAVTWFGTHVLRTQSVIEGSLPEDTAQKLKDLSHKQFGYDRTVVESFYKYNWN